MRIKPLSFLLRNDVQNFNNDNIHLIAISNINDGERSMERWWERKYKAPLKAYEDHTFEEILVEMFEDYYEKNPAEAQKFIQNIVTKGQDEWEGQMSDEHEAEMQKRFANPELLKKYQSEKELTEEEEKKLLDSLGRNLPGSKVTRDLSGGDGSGEFDDEFASLGDT